MVDKGSCSAWMSVAKRYFMNSFAFGGACSASLILLSLHDVLKVVSLGSMSEVFYLLQLRKNGLSVVVGGAEGDALSWTCS